mmetsp:Transcript_2313/g.3358  ORF Transcript_2313/g.3358 Transcript_2313/m.3358 type:complete len:114 (+) Transcript_2313:61-402(+)
MYNMLCDATNEPLYALPVHPVVQSRWDLSVLACASNTLARYHRACSVILHVVKCAVSPENSSVVAVQVRPYRTYVMASFVGIQGDWQLATALCQQNPDSMYKLFLLSCYQTIC